MKNTNKSYPENVLVITTVDADVDLTSPASNGTDEGGRACLWIDIATPGTLVVTKANGDDVTIPAMPPGYRLFGQFNTIKMTGTTASGLVVFY